MSISNLLPHLREIQKHIQKCEESIAQEFGVAVSLKMSTVDDMHFIDALTKIVSDVLRVPMHAILKSSRRAEIKEARQIAMLLCTRHIPDITLVKIGEYFGKDHTTVIHARDRINNLLDSNDAGMVRKVICCEERIGLRPTPTQNNESIIH